LDRVISVLERGISATAMPGCVVVVLRETKTLLHAALGTLDGTTQTTTHTLYDLASLTKPIATAATVLSLVERGLLTLSTPICEFFPETQSPATVRHLLTHTSGLPAWIPCYQSGHGIQAAINAILKLSTPPPETQYEYSCLNYILLAEIVRIASGKRLDHAATEAIFAPLGLESLTFSPKPEHCAPTHSLEGPDTEKDAGVVLRGIVHDGNARGIGLSGDVSGGVGDVSGNAGLFGTALDIARFGQAILSGKLFGTPTRQRLLTPQSTPGGHTYGFFCLPNHFTPIGELLPDTTIGHSGYTGTLLTLVPELSTVICLVSNAVFSHNAKSEFLLYRRRFLNAVAAEL
jgi:CubicO group peptidase (beta-lactamase class C family)